MRSILRDPFARGNVVRETVHVGENHSGCAWCGHVKRTRKDRAPFLYRYGWSDDQGPRQSGMQDRLFCSRACERAYNS